MTVIRQVELGDIREIRKIKMSDLLKVAGLITQVGQRRSFISDEDFAAVLRVKNEVECLDGGLLKVTTPDNGGQSVCVIGNKMQFFEAARHYRMIVNGRLRRKR